MPRWRIRYVSVGAGIGDDSMRQWSAQDCSGTQTAPLVGHQLTTSSAGNSDVRDLGAGTVALQYQIAARSGTSSAHVIIDWSANNAFTDTVLLLDETISYGGGVATATRCLPLAAAPVGNPCVYGTQVKPGVAAALTLLPDFIQSVANSRGMGWIASRFAGAYFTVLGVTDLCSRPPPVPGPIVANDFQGNFGRMIEALGALLWPELCECIPGSPSPIPYTPWVTTEPPGSATPPSFPVTTPGDPAALSQILSLLAQLVNMVAQDLETDTLEQRWRLPFATIPGATQTGLVDSGTTGLDRALGVLLTVTKLPEGVTTWPGNPIYIKDLGWVSVDDGGAMLQELRVTRQQQMWFPTQMQLANRFSWALTPGTEIAMQVLKVEP